ncbi:hypothetical protein AN3676.2 [Aspergillus nidulans FGSC A4]|nr:hypothetical protein AN3676.2 [Aspergillus nidulans FGSC A4]|eukprot:XP_661280.1 hypothetical protein AN3676.2 [Aspergillus nidulans FGSC A4]
MRLMRLRGGGVCWLHGVGCEGREQTCWLEKCEEVQSLLGRLRPVWYYYYSELSKRIKVQQ